MIDGNLLREKITSIYPEIGVCGIDVDVAFNKKKDVWVIDLKKDEKLLRTHLEIRDAERCMEGGKSCSLGSRVTQLTRNAKKL
ncbi:MAG: hypothetical protein P8130_03685 [Deltaproteobacteria bacterium]|jgi:hypothetical protein